MPDAIRNLFADIDREGRNLHVFARDVFEAALDYGVSYVLVDYSRVGDAQTGADMLSAGARPYRSISGLGMCSAGNRTASAWYSFATSRAW